MYYSKQTLENIYNCQRDVAVIKQKQKNDGEIIIIDIAATEEY